MKRTGQPRPRQTTVRRRKRRTRQNRRKAVLTYKRVVVAILILGSIFLAQKFYRLWEIKQDMSQTIQKEEQLKEENQKLSDKKRSLEYTRRNHTTGTRAIWTCKAGGNPISTVMTRPVYFFQATYLAIEIFDVY